MASQFPLIDGKPAWKIRIDHPDGFQMADHANDFRLFHLPGAALLSWVLKLTDPTSESLIVHHVFDLADPEPRKYLDLVAGSGRLLLVCEGPGGFEKELSVGSAKLRRLLEQGVRYNDRLPSLNGAEAVRTFLEIFNPVFRESGAEVAWSAVEKGIGLVSTSKPAIGPSSSGGQTSSDLGEESQTARIQGGKRPPAGQSESESETAFRGGDFEALVGAARIDLYRHNAFRILELPTSATGKEVDRRQKMIGMAAEAEAAVPPGPFRALPLEKVNPEVLGEAANRLRDPSRRIVDELFWFWSLGPGTSDEGIRSLGENRVRPAFESWKKQGIAGEGAWLATHNLAALCHAVALELEDPESAKALKDVSPQEAAGYWDLAYRAWKIVLESEGFWERLGERIRQIDDPRLPPSAAKRIRASLPLTLLSISAQLAARAAEKGNLAEAERHRKAMTQSGLERDLVERSLRAASAPLRDRIEALAAAAERDYLEDAEKGIEIADRLLGQTAALLGALDSLLPKGDSVRESSHDAVALRVHQGAVKYGKAKDIDEALIKTLKKALEVAGAESTRQAIEADIETAKRIIKENEENKVYRVCWFCKKRSPVLEHSATVAMYGNVTREWAVGRTRVKWQHSTLKVPRCKECRDEHTRTDKISGKFSALGAILGLAGSAAVFFAMPGRKEGGAFVGLGCGAIIACGVLAAIFGGIGRMVGLMMAPGGVRKESTKSTFPTVLDAIRQGWGIGTKPPGVS